MTLHEGARELEALELDVESIATMVSGIDTPRLHILAEAIRLELTDRYDGKPLDRRNYH